MTSWRPLRPNRMQKMPTDMGHAPHFDDFIQRLIRLKLWYVSRLARTEALAVDETIDRRTGLFKLTTFAGATELALEEDREGWAEMRQRLAAEHDAAGDVRKFESTGLELLWPHAEPMIDVRLARFDEFCSNAHGPFTFEVTDYYADDEAPDHVTLHVRNCYRPESPFEHPADVRQALREVLDEAADLRPDVEWIQCGSWLNSLPPFARLFPESWSDTAVPGKPGGHMGWWGQFQDRRGGFHEKNARRFRETGDFPHRHLLCHCRIDELRGHLKGS